MIPEPFANLIKKYLPFLCEVFITEVSLFSIICLEIFAPMKGTFHKFLERVQYALFALVKPLISHNIVLLGLTLFLYRIINVKLFC